MTTQNKIVIALLTLIVIIAVVWFVQNNQEKKQHEDLFEKKQECASYRREIEEKLKKESMVVGYHLDEIFYSPSKSSCLYSYQSYALKNYYIADYLTNENVFGSGGITDETERFKSWRERIEELKQ